MSRLKMIQTSAIGIDLGIVNSRVGVFANNELTSISRRATPSYVAFLSTTERQIGERAKSYFDVHPEDTAYHLKRLIGRKFNDYHVQRMAKNWFFKVIHGDGNELAAIRIGINFLDKQNWFYPQELLAMLLEQFKQQAEARLDHPVQSAVIAVPNLFTSSQRQATRDACEIAGFTDSHIVNKSTAVAIAYAHERSRNMSPNVNVVVYAFGGGSFNVTVFTIQHYRPKEKAAPRCWLLAILMELFNCSRKQIKSESCSVTIRSVGGDCDMGGIDFDILLMEHMAGIVKKKYGKKLNERSKRKLLQECEQAKCHLSSTSETKVYLGDVVGEGVYELITRETFVGLCDGLFSKTISILADTLENAGLEKEDIDEVVMVGGTSRIPKLFGLLDEFFPKQVLIRKLGQDDIAARGAAIIAAKLNNMENLPELIDFTSFFNALFARPAISAPTQVLVSQNTMTKPPLKMSICSECFQKGFKKVKNYFGEFYFNNLPPGSLRQNIYFHFDLDEILHFIVKNCEITENISNQLSPAEKQTLIEAAELYRENDVKRADLLEARYQLESYVRMVKRTITGKSEDKKFWSNRRKALDSGQDMMAEDMASTSAMDVQPSQMPQTDGNASGSVGDDQPATQIQQTEEYISSQDREIIEIIKQQLVHIDDWIRNYLCTSDAETLRKQLASFKESCEPIFGHLE